MRAVPLKNGIINIINQDLRTAEPGDTDRDVIIMVPDGSGKPGNVKTFKLSDVRGAHNVALSFLSDRIIILEGEEL